MHRELRTDSAAAAYAERKTLIDQAVSVLGERERAYLDGLTNRQVRERVLHRLAPTFECQGRADEGVQAAFDWAMRERTSAAAPSQSAQPSQQRSDGHYDQRRIDAQLIELEQARQDAWRPKKPSPAVAATERDVDAELRELETRRHNAWRKPPAA